MCANLVNWQELCGTDQVTVKKVCQTCWMSNFACPRNHNRIMPALLRLLQTVSRHSNVYRMLTDLENQLVMMVSLHMLEQLNSLSKLCQGCDVHLDQIAGYVNEVISRMKTEYIQGARQFTHKAWTDFIDVNGAETPLAWGTDGYLYFRAGEGQKHVLWVSSEGKEVKVNRLLFDRMVIKVKLAARSAAEAIVEDLRKRFGSTALLSAFAVSLMRLMMKCT